MFPRPAPGWSSSYCLRGGGHSQHKDRRVTPEQRSPAWSDRGVGPAPVPGSIRPASDHLRHFEQSRQLELWSRRFASAAGPPHAWTRNRPSCRPEPGLGSATGSIRQGIFAVKHFRSRHSPEFGCFGQHPQSLATSATPFCLDLPFSKVSIRQPRPFTALNIRW